MTAERTTKRADQLVPGDWFSGAGNSGFPGQRPSEILWTKPFTNSVDTDRVFIAYIEQGFDGPQSVRVNADEPVRILTADERAEIGKLAERDRFISGLHEFADWLGENPWAPTMRDNGYFQHARFQIDLHGENDDATTETIDRVRAFAELLGVKVDESLDDRTDVSVEIGAVAYSVIAWHKGGRPAEPEPVRELTEAVAADPTGLTYSREADDPTPVSPARGWHGGSVVDGGELVDETPAEPWVAQFFTFGSGHVSESGEDLYGKYVAVIGPDRESCRAAMVVKYGAEWAFQYDDLPGGALLFEHDVIDLSAAEPVAEPVECSPGCRDLDRPDQGVHFLGCPNFSTPMSEAR